jgi:HEAT repeat protein
VPRFLDRLDEKKETTLLAGLRDPSPHVRLAVARAVPRHATDEVFSALLTLLNDPYAVLPRQAVGDPYPVSIISSEVQGNILPDIGKPILPALLAYIAKNRENPVALYYAIPVLGELGPDDHSIECLQERFVNGTHDQRHSTLKALGKLGKKSQGILLAIATDENLKSGTGVIQRRVAIEQLALCGDADACRITLVKLLDHKESQLVGAAIDTIRILRIREAIPQLILLAAHPDWLKDRNWQNPQSSAIAAVAALADRAVAEKFLLEMLDTQSASARGKAAGHLAALNLRAAIPKLVDALADKDWYVRATADSALRGFARKPEGIGYDPGKPEPKLWREYWRERK